MESMSTVSSKVQAHYHQHHLVDTILSALTAQGKDPNHFTEADLAPVDEFHVRGRQATIELAEKLDLDATQRVLDIGSGLGGASRFLAATYGCRVTGIDVTAAYVHTAEWLADRLGFDSLVTYRTGNALALPFENRSFDVVWTQHVSMNIADKNRLYREFGRVLKPGGTLALYDILAGPQSPVHFPVPCAKTGATSFLVSPDILRAHLESAGFIIQSWKDTTVPGRVFIYQLAEQIRLDQVPPVSLRILLGSDFQSMVHNIARNLNENRIVLAEVVARSP